MSELSLLKGVGPKRQQLWKDMGIHTLKSFAYYLPRTYQDRTRFLPVEEWEEGRGANLVGIVTHVQSIGGNPRSSRLKVTLQIEELEKPVSLELTYFNGAHFWKSQFLRHQDKRVQVWGKLQFFGGWQMTHPEVTFLKEGQEPSKKVYPIYSLTEAMQGSKIEHKWIQKTILEALTYLETQNGGNALSNILPKEIEDTFDVQPEWQLLKQIHNPKDIDQIESCLEELKIRELVPICLDLEKEKALKLGKGTSLDVSKEYYTQAQKHLPFDLTQGQEAAVAEIYKGIACSDPFLGMLQGDVGSGKTAVAWMSCLGALEKNKQVVFLAPTEILAEQQYQNAQQFFAWDSNINVEILTGSLSKKQRVETLEGISLGRTNLVIGTHAVFSEDVIYKNLCLVVIDEQHRFGVDQRQRLMDKGRQAGLESHVLYMSATPIPQSLFQTLYGDIVSVVLKEKPQGRQQAKTRIVPQQKRGEMVAFLEQESKKEEQFFWVVPRVYQGSSQTASIPSMNTSEAEETAPKKSLEELEQELHHTPLASKIGVLHGKLSSEEKSSVLAAFSHKQTTGLLATTVIEVGVDIPAANYMVIENPDCFGMAQLHQLRGRIGRGGGEPWCFLLEPEGGFTPETAERLRQFANLEDGFEIAELDLSLRGGGSLQGVAQSGFRELQYVDLVHDTHLILDVREKVREIIPQ
jgi:ATP-dependent DNA helicase RecG